MECVCEDLASGPGWRRALGHGRGSEGPGEGPGPAGSCRPRALPAVTLISGPCAWCPAWRAGRAWELHPLQARRGPGGSGVPSRAMFVGDKRSAETWHPDSARSPHQRPQAALGLPSLHAWPARCLAPCWVGTRLVGVCEPPPSLPPRLGTQSHWAECRVFKLPPTGPPGLLLGHPPSPGLDLLHQDPSPGRPRRGGPGPPSEPCSQGLPAAHVSPLAVARWAGPAPGTLPQSPGTSWLELPKPLRGLHRPRYLSVRISSVLDVLLHPKMRVS